MAENIAISPRIEPQESVAALNALLAIPIEVRLAVLFLVGTLLGSWVNWAVAVLAYHRPAIGPWFPPPIDRKPRNKKNNIPLIRTWADRIPIFGWLGLRRESHIHGSRFWIRPLLVEITLGVGIAALYWWEVDGNGLMAAGRPHLLRQVPGAIARPLAAEVELTLSLHIMFLGHAMLVALMLAASLIDFDEKTIPDAITVPGTLAGLLLGGLFPWSLLPAGITLLPSSDPLPAALPRAVEFLTTTSPMIWPASLIGSPRVGSLLLALSCYWAWTTALLYRPWRPRRGWGIAFRILGRHMRTDFLRPSFLLMNTLGPLVIALVWWNGGNLSGVHWIGLLSALLAMAIGGAMIWAVRIIGTLVLRKEAMGFGDVTLMAMIGTFLGWQSCLLIFFLAPMIALVFGLAQYIFRRESELFYGPFLCLASLVVIVRWHLIWNWASPIFSLGWIIPAVMVVAFMLMAIMLAMLQLAKWVFRGRGS